MKPIGDDMPDPLSQPNPREWANQFQIRLTVEREADIYKGDDLLMLMLREFRSACYLHAASVARDDKEQRMALASEAKLPHAIDYNSARAHEALNLEEIYLRLAKELEQK